MGSDEHYPVLSASQPYCQLRPLSPHFPYSVADARGLRPAHKQPPHLKETMALVIKVGKVVLQKGSYGRAQNPSRDQYDLSRVGYHDAMASVSIGRCAVSDLCLHGNLPVVPPDITIDTRPGQGTSIADTTRMPGGGKIRQVS
jgi:hypothetical protein